MKRYASTRFFGFDELKVLLLAFLLAVPLSLLVESSVRATSSKAAKDAEVISPVNVAPESTRQEQIDSILDSSKDNVLETYGEDNLWRRTNDLYVVDFASWTKKYHDAYDLSVAGMGERKFFEAWDAYPSLFDNRRELFIQSFLHKYKVIGMSLDSMHALFGKPCYKVTKGFGYYEFYSLLRNAPMCGNGLEGMQYF